MCLVSKIIVVGSPSGAYELPSHRFLTRFTELGMSFFNGVSLKFSQEVVNIQNTIAPMSIVALRVYSLIKLVMASTPPPATYMTLHKITRKDLRQLSRLVLSTWHKSIHSLGEGTSTENLLPQMPTGRL